MSACCPQSCPLRLEVADGEVHHRIYIVAYDLIGGTGYRGSLGARRDQYIQSVISNWFIAFGGFTQRTEFGGGDLGFGFFHSLRPAVQASLWAGHHLDLLRGTNSLLGSEGPYAGFGICQDELRAGHMKQVKSDWLSMFSKAWKHEAERMADNAKRDRAPTIALHANLFSGLHEIPSDWFGSVGDFDGIPVRFVQSGKMSDLPWR